MTVLILHGIGGYAGIHWQQWLHDQLIKNNCTVLMPNLPLSNKPNRRIWLSVVQQLVSDGACPELVIVGHSLGVVTALDLIETLNKPVKALISVSGFFQDYGAELNSYFLKEKNLDLDRIKQNLQYSYVLFGDNDPYVPQNVLHSLAKQLNVNPIIFKNGGHLNSKSGYSTFPKLLELINQLNNN